MPTDPAMQALISQLKFPSGGYGSQAGPQVAASLSPQQLALGAGQQPFGVLGSGSGPNLGMGGGGGTIPPYVPTTSNFPQLGAEPLALGGGGLRGAATTAEELAAQVGERGLLGRAAPLLAEGGLLTKGATLGMKGTGAVGLGLSLGGNFLGNQVGGNKSALGRFIKGAGAGAGIGIGA